MGRFELGDGLRQAWNVDGWCVVPDAIPPDDLAAAQEVARQLFPTPEEMAAGALDPDDERTRPWRDWDAAWPELPYQRTALNRLAVHPVLIDLAEDLLGTDDLRLYMSIITAKYAGQPSGYNQLLHTDYPNHTVLVPSPDAAFGQVEFFVYLSDVTAANGATRLVSRRLTDHIQVERHTLSLEEYGHLYEEPGEACGTAGSVVVYRPDTYHRSIDFADPTAQRIMMHVSMRPAAADWGGYQAWPIKGFSPEWGRFVAKCEPRQLALVGFPRPGHPYWTEETLAGVAARYPGLDTGPWRRVGA